MFKTMVSFVILLIARIARIAGVDRQTHIHTHTHIYVYIQDNYCNPRCACAPRVNNIMFGYIAHAQPPMECRVPRAHEFLH